MLIFQHVLTEFWQIFLVLIKLNLFFLVAFIVQYDLIDVHFEEPEYALTLALIPAVLLVMILGIWFVRKEYKYAMVAVIVRNSFLTRHFVTNVLFLRLDLLSGPNRLLTEPDHHPLRPYIPGKYRRKRQDAALRDRIFGLHSLQRRLCDSMLLEF